MKERCDIGKGLVITTTMIMTTDDSERDLVCLRGKSKQNGKDSGNEKNNRWNKVPENRGEGNMYFTNALDSYRRHNSCFILYEFSQLEHNSKRYYLHTI